MPLSSCCMLIHRWTQKIIHLMFDPVPTQITFATHTAAMNIKTGAYIIGVKVNKSLQTLHQQTQKIIHLMFDPVPTQITFATHTAAMNIKTGACIMVSR